MDNLSAYVQEQASVVRRALDRLEKDFHDLSPMNSKFDSIMLDHINHAVNEARLLEKALTK